MLNTALIAAKGGEAPNVNMETWTENWQELYDEGLAKGKDPNTNEGFIHLGANFPNSVQGWYVPTYMVKGDAKRGIKASAPGLKSVSDMPKYWELFKDPEDPSKGLFYSCIPGWSCKTINDKKFEAYGIKKYYNIMEPGSGAALAASMEAAYKRGKPWIGYYWAPTWVLGKLDMTQLEEPPFDKESLQIHGGLRLPGGQVRHHRSQEPARVGTGRGGVSEELRNHPGYQQQVSGPHARYRRQSPSTAPCGS
jgi:glycine betaine/proline transport system substrate-binding protein